jgi:cysteine desulfurase/selenocysteine lyase
MNTRTSTSEAGLPGPESLGLPGEAELARWATALFNALPDQWEPGKTCPDLARNVLALAEEASQGKTGVPDGLPDFSGVLPEKPRGVASFAPDFSAREYDAFSRPAGVVAVTAATQEALHGAAQDALQGVGQEWPKGIPASAAAAASASSGTQVPLALQVPLPDIRVLGAWQGELERQGKRQGERQSGGTPSVPYYFLAHETAFPSGIRVPGATPFGEISPTQHALLPGQPFDVQAVRQDFPILRETVSGGRPLVWLDNAATTQKPQAVIDRLARFYAHENSNIHRAAHELAARATDAYEAAREIARRFLNARSANEIIFVRGTTEGINLVAQSWGRQHLKAGDAIIITWLEHHANIVPWQQLAAQTGAVLKVAPVNERGEVCVEEYEKILATSNAQLVAFTQVSNALGTVPPARLLTHLAHAHGARVLVDGAQSVSHLRADVQTLGCDWFVFSGHKVFGPTGIGVVYGREELLNATDPWQGGGNMIEDVTFEKTRYQQTPARFEAGTGNIADAVGLGAALEYVERIGIDNIARHEHDLLLYGTRLLEEIPGVRLIGRAAEKAGVLSFVLDGHKTEDIGAALSKEGIAVRAGHHCAQPILRRFGLEATVRPSLALYNTHADLDALAAAVRKIR